MEGRLFSFRFIKIAFAKYKLRMTPKIIAHNEELQKLDKKIDTSQREYSSYRPWSEQKKDRQSKISRGSQPYSPYFTETPFYTPFNHVGSSQNMIHVGIPTLDEFQECQNEEIVHKMLDYLDI